MIAARDACSRPYSDTPVSRIGVLVLMVYLIFAMTLYLLPPRGN